MELNENNDRDAGRWVDDQIAALGPASGWEPNVGRGLALLRERRERSVNGGTRRWAVLAAASIVTCVSVMATPVTRAFAQRCLTACVNESVWVRQFLSASRVVSTAYVKPEERKMAPDFTLDDASGTPVRLSDYRGKVVLLNFWATWCGPCRMEMPLFVEFQQAYRDRGFSVLGVSVDDEGWSAVRPYVDAKKINYPVMVAGGQISNLFGGLKAIPTTLIIDRHGRIAATHTGLCRKDEYEGDLKAALNESQ